ncbi:hypothetical protein ACLMAL_36500 (plasmid) [Nocardia sp. CWNU-33]|uniref:hypothetical protein n=1 Tax=Nocardia sp. CWNU-33 TaxID=3392117 RepID=UPI00398E95FC
MRASVTVEGVDGAWTVTFSDRDNELLDAMKHVVPSADRRYEPAERHWRIGANTRTMAAVCETFEGLGALVTKPGTLNTPHPDTRSSDQVEILEQKCRALETAANWMRQQITQLEEERDELADRLRIQTTQSSASGNWADILFDALPPDLRDSVFKALTRCLHPDVSGADHTLQQELNAARDNWRGV